MPLLMAQWPARNTAESDVSLAHLRFPKKGEKQKTGGASLLQHLASFAILQACHLRQGQWAEGRFPRPPGTPRAS